MAGYVTQSGWGHVDHEDGQEKMKQITVTDENQEVIGTIQFDGKQIISDSPFLQELVDKKDDFLPEELSKRFEMLPARYSYGSRMFFGNVEEV